MKYPRHLERAYAARLLRRLQVARRLVLERVRHPGRVDNKADPVPPPNRPPPTASISAVRRAFEVALPVEPDSLLPTARAIDAWATGQTVREVSAIVGVDLEGDTRLAASRVAARTMHWQWARENADLITSMEADTFHELAEHVAEAVVQGRTDLAEVIRDRFGVAESRARLIARDQIAKLNGRITEERQTALGVTRYEWSSSGDERVRPKHRALDGKVRRWDDPHPTEGHPGSAIACRCVAIAVLEDEAELPTSPEPRPAPVVVQPPRPAPAPAPRPALPATFGGPPVPPRPPPPPPRPALPATFGGAPPPAAPPPPPPPPPPPAAPAGGSEPPRPPLDLSDVGDLHVLGGPARQVIARRMGRDITPEEIVAWAGAEQADLGADARIAIEYHADGGVSVEIGARRFHLERVYKWPIANHSSFDVEPPFRRQGLGATILGNQVDALRRAGFTRIDTFAAGRKGSVRYNGYNTWPTLGFEGPIPRSVRANLPPDLEHATMLSDLMATDRGAEWWEEWGDSVSLEFDLDPGSYSSQTLADYLASPEYLMKRLARKDQAGEPREDGSEPERAEEIDLDEDDFRALRRIHRERAAARALKPSQA